MLRRLVLLLLLWTTVYPPRLAQAAPDGWASLAAGIEFQIFHLSQPRPINLFVARLNRAEASATIDSAIAHGSLASGREKISDMAGRADGAINTWGGTWGDRNRVLVAINGYYFNLGSGAPLSGQIQSGWYAQRFSDYTGDAGFAWNLNRSAFIGKCVFHTPIHQLISISRSGEIQKITGVNTPRGDDELILYTPQHGASTGTDNRGVEILVKMSRPSLVLPAPAKAVGRAVQMRDGQGDTRLPFDHLVLSASGSTRSALLGEIRVGDEIGVSQEISDCAGSPPTYWTKTYASLGGDYHFLTGGDLTIDDSNPDAAVPNSRTAVAYNAASVYFIVVDGWNPGVSEGISIRELGEFTRDTLGASDGVTLDSGGSSTMVVRGQVVNNTYCNFTRRCGTGSRDRTAPDLEPLVGNSLMMISVEPKAQSSAFIAGQSVSTAGPAGLRLGPGSNYAAIASLPAGAQGAILPMRYTNLNGVLAKGSYWWRVEFGDLSGWIAQEALVWTPPPGAALFYLPLVRR